MDSFIRRHKLPGDAARRIRNSPDPLDKTVAIVWHPANNSYPHPVVPDYTNRLNKPVLRQKPEEDGFGVVISCIDVELGTNSIHPANLAGTWVEGAGFEPANPFGTGA